MDCKIYAMADPENPRIPRYVGRTTCSFHARWLAHLSRARNQKNKTPASVWFLELASKGVYPHFSLLEKTTKAQGAHREESWIAFFKPLKTLTNLSDGPGAKGLHPKTKPTLGAWEKSVSMLKGRKLTAEVLARRKSSPAFQAAVRLHALRNAREIICLDTGEIFSTVTSAAKSINMAKSMFRAAIKRGGTARGKRWAYVNAVSI